MSRRQNDKKQKAPSEHSLKTVLGKFGYSKDTTDKIWKWYNPSELNGSKLKINNNINEKID